MHFGSVVILFTVVLSSAASGGMNWPKFLGCAGLDLGSCPGRQLHARYKEMTRANCLNCDKYFHCKGNFDAVKRCGGDAANNRRIAEKISNCREAAQDANSKDSQADQVANRFGRDGKNCENEYLCKAKCKYNPSKKTCHKSNCS